MYISSWEIISLLFHKRGKAGREERNPAQDHQLSRKPVYHAPKNSGISPYGRENPWASLQSPSLPLEKFPKIHSLLGVGCAALGQAFQLTVTAGVWGVRQQVEEGKGPNMINFKGENIFLKIQRLCAVGVNITDLLSWAGAENGFFYRKKEMHGCGAASSKGSFQATCHGAIYRHKSQKGCSEAVERVWLVGCGAWHLASGHADLTQHARVSPLCTAVSGQLEWKEQRENTVVQRGNKKMEPRKEEK